MKLSFDWLKQFHLLTLILVLVFGASAVVIVFERSRSQAESQLAARAQKDSFQAVQGQSVVSDQAVADYRQFAGDIFKSIQTLTDRALSGAELNPGQAKSLESSLLESRVPLPYQELHLGLLRIVRGFRNSEGLNLDFLEEQSRLLSREYPWLALASGGAK